MQVVDRIASSGYSYISPTVDRACNVVPILGGLKQRIEPYAPPLIKKADMCIDTVYGVVEVRATALRGVANSAGNKALHVRDSAYSAVEERALALRDAGGRAQKMIGESVVVVRVHKTSLAIVDTLDMLIDRYLPDPQAEDETKHETPDHLIPRLLHIPFKIPVRMMNISIAKARNGCDVIQVRIHWASQLTSDQKAKLQAFILSRTQAVSNRVSSSSLAITLRQGGQSTSKMLQDALQSIDNGKKAAGVKCYIALEQLHVIEMKDWLLGKVCAMQHATVDCTSDIFVALSHRVYDVASFVIGQDRATNIFTLVGKKLPMLKIIVRASSSTGALPDTPSDEAELEVEPKSKSSTGATEVMTAPVANVEEYDDGMNNEATTAPTRQVSEVVEAQVVEVENVPVLKSKDVDKMMNSDLKSTFKAQGEKVSQQGGRTVGQKKDKKVPLKVPRVQRAFN